MRTRPASTNASKQLCRGVRVFFFKNREKQAAQNLEVIHRLLNQGRLFFDWPRKIPRKSSMNVDRTCSRDKTVLFKYSIPFLE